jgi:polar amino acid transport system substrate-binding protein
VGTLSGTAAEDILRATDGIQVFTNPEIIYSYADLEAGKVDAVLLDTPIAAAYGATNASLVNVGESFGEGHYVIACRYEDAALMSAVNQALERMRASGELKAILEHFGILDQHQRKIGID